MPALVFVVCYWIGRVFLTVSDFFGLLSIPQSDLLTVFVVLTVWCGLQGNVLTDEQRRSFLTIIHCAKLRRAWALHEADGDR